MERTAMSQKEFARGVVLARVEAGAIKLKEAPSCSASPIGRRSGCTDASGWRGRRGWCIAA